MTATGATAAAATPGAVGARAAPQGAWRLLADGVRDTVVLAADFSATGRSVATFAEFASALRPEHPFWETALPPLGEEAGMTGAGHTERWLSEVRARGRRVHAVLGFCAGSVFAAALSHGVARWQGERPGLVLLDPQLPDPSVIHEQYRKLVTGRLAPALGPGEVDAAEAAGREALRNAAAPADLAAALGDLVGAVGGPALERLGLEEERRAEFVAVFTAYLWYLAAAAELDPAPAWATATAISSSTPNVGLNTLPPRRRHSAVAREVRVDAGYGDLLRSPEVVRTVRGLLW